MTDYNLSGLNTRSFEQLVQAIAAKVFGLDVIIFGDGPDGGREATFEGAVPYPSKEKHWDGYGVIQAKFLQRPQGSPHDGDWALEQLRDELTKFGWAPRGPRGGKPKRKAKKGTAYKRRMPEYYVFVTNAVLTPVGGKGTKDKAYAILEDFKADKGLKGFDVWDYDKLCAYLDGLEDIRHSYEGFITTGDVLARVMEWLRPQRPDFEQVIYKFLQSELISDQYANLEQAGRATEEKVPIARVFVDLPAYDEQLNDPPDETGSPTSELSPGIVAELVEIAKSRLDPASVKASTASADVVWMASGPSATGRLVLIGGPGQGKTTIGQFICQLFRASILKGRAGWVPVREVEDILSLINAQCASEGTELPTARRFPLRIVLSDLAKELAAPGLNRVTSVLSYVAARIKKRADEEVPLDDIRLWLKNYPWLVIFDGLDEVPASSNRDDVLRVIQGFRVEINESNSDVLILATTRPQGYNEDFSPTVYRHKWLAPLSASRALHYARRLIAIRYAADKDRQELVSGRLERAANTEATARLMRSPLQVTIMTTLVGTRGQPPQERWGLFSEYYKVIYQREVERDIPASDILRAYKSDIDRIHNRVGLILQAKSERSGETDASLSKKDFAAVVADRLEEEGHEGPERDRLQERITEAATDRLVFLVGLQDELIGFEIRSLQEFMAAEALMDEGEEIVRRRLGEIAPTSNWRNVFLFAAGKCFSERQELRDSIHTLCAELNDSVTDEVSSSALEGSHLAMDILEEGVVRTQPKYTRLFTRLALRALSLPPSDTHARLANLYDSGLEVPYQDELNQRLESADFHRTLGAWACLGRLIASGVTWAREMGEQHWPAESGQQLDVLQVTAGVKEESWRLSKLAEAVPRIQPHKLVWRRRRRGDNQFIFEGVKSGSAPTWLLAAKSLASRELALSADLKIPVKLGQKDGELSLTIHKMSGGPDVWAKDLLGMPATEYDGWKPILTAAQFMQEPTKQALAQVLRTLAGIEKFELVKNNSRKLPWVLAACIDIAECGSDLDRLATSVEAGELGGQEDWEVAEKRWTTDGLAAKDFEYACGDRLPFDRNIASQGFAFTAVKRWSIGLRKSSEFISALVGLHSRLESCIAKRFLAAWTLSVLTARFSPERREINPTTINLTNQQLIDLLSDAASTKANIRLAALDEFNLEAPLDGALIEALDSAGRQAQFTIGDHSNPRLLNALSAAFEKHPERLGLLWLISLAVAKSGKSSLSAELLDPNLYADSKFRAAAIITRLAHDDVTIGEAEILARHAAAISKESWSADGVLYMVEENRQAFGPVLDKLLITLLKHLPTTEWQTAQRAVQALRRSLKRRTSGLEGSDLWERLSLRPRLNILVNGNGAPSSIL